MDIDYKTLCNASCEAYGKTSRCLDKVAIEQYLKAVDQWRLLNVNGVDQIEKEFRFKNYGQALTFANAVAEIAEQNNHHPKIILEWGRVVVTWWTHKVGDLHKNDFIMAAKVDGLHVD